MLNKDNPHASQLSMPALVSNEKNHNRTVNLNYCLLIEKSYVTRNKFWFWQKDEITWYTITFWFTRPCLTKWFFKTKEERDEVFESINSLSKG